MSRMSQFHLEASEKAYYLIQKYGRKRAVEFAESCAHMVHSMPETFEPERSYFWETVVGILGKIDTLEV